jgi:Tetratricopeptide repeat
LHRQTLELRRKVLGPKSRGTLTSMNNLGGALSEQVKYVEAEQMHWQELGAQKDGSMKEAPGHPNAPLFSCLPDLGARIIL